MCQCKITMYEYESKKFDEIEDCKKEKLVYALKKINEDFKKINKNFTNNSDDNDGIFSIYYDRFRAKNYVGFACIEDLCIQVLPKVYKSKDNTESSSDSIKKLLLLLNISEKLGIREYDAVYLSTRTKRISIYEALIFLFVQRLKKALSEGPYYDYVLIYEESSKLRGKLILRKQIEKLPHQLTTFSIRYSSRLQDNLLNQILKYTIKVSKQYTTIESTKRDLKLLSSSFFSNVSDLRTVEKKHFSKITFNRLNERFHIPLNLAKIILMGLEGFGREKVPGFFVDMNQLFENVVYNFIKQQLIRKKLADYKVNYQKDIGYLLFENNYGLNKLKPDIVITKASKENDIILIIDAKYKEVSQEFDPSDIYQLFSYSKRSNCDVALIYPKCKEFNSDLEFRELTFFDKSHLHVIPFDLEFDEKSQSQTIDNILYILERHSE